MTLLRLAWILGLVSTREYHAQSRKMRFGAGLPTATDAALQRLDRSLTADRIAVVLFLVSTVLLVYTWVHGPAIT